MHVVGTAGHVDHGKSALVEALTGMDPDRFEEEKRRGLTIDLGFAWFTLPSGREVGIVDVPGHERFIRNMLAGVGAIEVVLFVVAADEGWMPQSEEHLQILDFLRIKAGVVAITKIDVVEHEMLDLAVEDVRKHLRDSCLEDARIVPVSSVTEGGVDELRTALDDVLARVPQARDHGRPRLFIDRSFTIAGAGTVVTGTLTGGRLRTGDDVEIAPQGVRARLRSLQTHKRAVDEAVPGSRVAANLVGLERTEIRRGDAIVRPGQWVTTDTFAARIDVSPRLAHPLTARGAYELYVGTAEPRCRLKLLERGPDTDAIVTTPTPDGLVPGVRPGSSALVQIFPSQRLPLAVGDRFVIRDVGRRETVAGGVVLDQQSGTIRRGDESQIRRLRDRDGLEGTELAMRIVAERGVVAAAELRLLTGAVLSDSPFEIDAAHGRRVEERAQSLVAGYHEAHPLEAGMPREALRSELELSPDAFAYLLRTWHGLTLEGNTVRSAERKASLDPPQREVADRGLETLRAAGYAPPALSVAGLAMPLAKTLERSGELVFVAPEIAYPADVWSDIERSVAEEIRINGPVTVARVRDLLGASRKYTVPLLEKLDATGVTRRQGDVRELGPRGRDLQDR